MLDISLKELLSIDEAYEDIKKVLEQVEESGKVVLLKDNKPVYVILKFDGSSDSDFLEKKMAEHKSKNKLHDAMKIVLLTQPDYTMHAVDLANEIYKKELYLKKDGTKARPNQIRARANNYQHLFKAANNFITLIDLD